jgi:hypothetical protein
LIDKIVISVPKKDTVLSIDPKEKVVHGEENDYHYTYLINTFSLPIFLSMLGIDNHGINFIQWKFYSSYYQFPHNTGLYQMIYNSSDSCNITRATLFNRDLFIESSEPSYSVPDAEFVYKTFGVRYDELFNLPINTISPGRFNLIDGDTRKALFHWLTGNYNIYCLGRYGSWSYKITNDVWEDTDFICKIIDSKEKIKKWERKEI